jgi:hypothetical protein
MDNQLYAEIDRLRCELDGAKTRIKGLMEENKVLQRALDLVDEGDDTTIAADCIRYARPEAPDA